MSKCFNKRNKLKEVSTLRQGSNIIMKWVNIFQKKWQAKIKRNYSHGWV